jgi:Fe-S oxidoreductase
MEPLQALHELRFRLVEEGHVLPQHTPVIEGLRKEHNMLMKPKVQRGKWADGIKVKDLSKEKAEVLFHAGCRFSYDGGLGQAPSISVDILQKAGVDFGIMGSGETCCGGRALHMGYQADFTRAAKHTITMWGNAGVKTVVTPCSDCYHTFKRLYPEMGIQVEVLHIVEFVDRLVKQGKVKFTRPVPMKVTYHDPCHLGRQGEPYVSWKGKEKKIFGQAVVYDPPRPRYNGANGVYEPPRDLLKTIPGLELFEMERIKEAGWCCGSGGGVREAYPDFSSWTAQERIEEARSTGADAIVSACPWCERNFMDAVGGIGVKLKVLDVMDLVQQAI